MKFIRNSFIILVILIFGFTAKIKSQTFESLTQISDFNSKESLDRMFDGKAGNRQSLSEPVVFPIEFLKRSETEIKTLPNFPQEIRQIQAPLPEITVDMEDYGLFHKSSKLSDQDFEPYIQNSSELGRNQIKKIDTIFKIMNIPKIGKELCNQLVYKEECSYKLLEKQKIKIKLSENLHKGTDSVAITDRKTNTICIDKTYFNKYEKLIDIPKEKVTGIGPLAIILGHEMQHVIDKRTWGNGPEQGNRETKKSFEYKAHLTQVYLYKGLSRIFLKNVYFPEMNSETEGLYTKFTRLITMLWEYKNGICKKPELSDFKLDNLGLTKEEIAEIRRKIKQILEAGYKAKSAVSSVIEAVKINYPWADATTCDLDRLMASSILRGALERDKEFKNIWVPSQTSDSQSSHLPNTSNNNASNTQPVDDTGSGNNPNHNDNMGQNNNYPEEPDNGNWQPPEADIPTNPDWDGIGGSYNNGFVLSWNADMD